MGREPAHRVAELLPEGTQVLDCRTLLDTLAVMPLTTRSLTAGLVSLTCSALTPADLAADPPAQPPSRPRPPSNDPVAAASRPAPGLRLAAHDRQGRPVQWPSATPSTWG